MKYITTETETQEKKVVKETKFDIGDMVSYEDPDMKGSFIFVIDTIRITNNWQVSYPHRNGFWIADQLTLVRKSNN